MPLRTVCLSVLTVRQLSLLFVQYDSAAGGVKHTMYFRCLLIAISWSPYVCVSMHCVVAADVISVATFVKQLASIGQTLARSA